MYYRDQLNGDSLTIISTKVKTEEKAFNITQNIYCEYHFNLLTVSPVRCFAERMALLFRTILQKKNRKVKEQGHMDLLLLDGNHTGCSL